jgi:hypothetical protein
VVSGYASEFVESGIIGKIKLGFSHWCEAPFFICSKVQTRLAWKQYFILLIALAGSGACTEVRTALRYMLTKVNA